jgi:hypothetical protein
VDLSEQLDTEDIIWKIAGAGAGLAAAAATRWMARTIWRQARHAEPPTHPESPEIGWGDAIAWAALTGMSVAIAELFAKRIAASQWQKSRGHLPKSLAA